MKITILILESLNGFIAKSHGDDLSWATREDRDFFISTTKKIGTMIMGSTTFNNMKGIKGTAFRDRNIVVMTTKPQDYQDYKNNFAKDVKFISGSPQDIVTFLESKGINSAVVIGGSQIMSQFLKSNYVDEIYLTIAPYVFPKGISIFDDSLPEIQLSLLEVSKISQNEILIHYKVNR